MGFVWKYYNKNSRMWIDIPSVDQDAIQTAFERGDPSYVSSTQDAVRITQPGITRTYVFQYMVLFWSPTDATIPLKVGIDYDGEAAISRSWVYTDDTKDQAKPLQWLFEFSPGEYHPMNHHVSSCLSTARKNNYKEIHLHDYNKNHDEWFTKRYDIANLLQTNLYSGTIRSLSPAPIEDEPPWDDPVDGDWNPPEHFCCPMTLSLMKDPVIAADGKSYERSAIEGWFCRGKVTSPLTNEKFVTAKLYPNINLRSAIEDAISAQLKLDAKAPIIITKSFSCLK